MSCGHGFPGIGVLDLMTAQSVGRAVGVAGEAGTDRLPMNSHVSGPTIGMKIATSVHTSAGNGESDLDAREREISAITSRINMTAAVADQTMSYHAGSSGFMDADMRRA